MATPDAVPESTHIGWIGTGVMGRHMAAHLLAAGYPLTVHTRTRAKAEPLLETGARWAATPAEAAAASHVVITMVGFPRDVRQVTLGEHGTLAAARPGTVLVDMTTSEPALAVEIAAAAVARDVRSLDAPVSGGDVGARDARLSIMIGGDEATASRLQPVWSRLGCTVVYHGAPGSGQHAKLANQTLIAAGMIGVCEGLLYAYRAGLDLDRVLESVSVGAAGSWSLANYAPRIMRNQFDPGFFVEHFVKDMGMALAEARRMNLALPGLALAHQLYVALVAQGHGRLGTHSLQLALASLSGIDWQARPAHPPPKG